MHVCTCLHVYTCGHNWVNALWVRTHLAEYSEKSLWFFAIFSGNSRSHLWKTSVAWGLPFHFRQVLDEFSAGLCSEHMYNNHSWRCLPQPETKRRWEWILRMEDARTSEEDDTDSQHSNIPIDHSHLARNCSIKEMLAISLAGSIILLMDWADENVKGRSGWNFSYFGQISLFHFIA